MSMFVDAATYQNLYTALTTAVLINERGGHVDEKSRKELPPTVWDLSLERFQALFGDFSKNPRYFYRKQMEFEKTQLGGDVKDVAIIAGLSYIGITLPETISSSGITTRKNAQILLDQFKESYANFERPSSNIPKHVASEYQAIEPESQENLRLSRPKGVAAIAREYLTGRIFWLYYTTDRDRDLQTKPGEWVLVRSIIEFIDVGKTNLMVKIKNNATNHRVDYEGFTEFDHSTTNVLVITLFHAVSLARHLTVMINIDLPKSTLFLGQYINYNIEGHVFTGALILEEIIKNEVDSVDELPKSAATDAEYFIIKGTNVSRKHPKSFKAIVPYFYDRASTFHRTPNNIFSTESLSAYLAARQKSAD